jgi:hypothetical protein
MMGMPETCFGKIESSMQDEEEREERPTPTGTSRRDPKQIP